MRFGAFLVYCGNKNLIKHIVCRRSARIVQRQSVCGMGEKYNPREVC